MGGLGGSEVDGAQIGDPRRWRWRGCGRESGECMAAGHAHQCRSRAWVQAAVRIQSADSACPATRSQSLGGDMAFMQTVVEQREQGQRDGGWDCSWVLA